MSDASIASVVGLVAVNSLEYVSQAFSNLNQGNTVINLRSDDDVERISAFQINNILNVKSSFGWYEGIAYKPQPKSEKTAQVLFTSGTEGKPKSILISHRALANTTKRLIDVMEVDAGIKEYVGVPVNYSFGFGRCRVVSAIGGRFYVPENGFDPEEIADMLGRGEINSISAVPTLWRIVLSNQDLFSGIGHKLKWIEIGSQYMSRNEKEQLKTIFPNANIVQHYGLTEASRTTFLKIHEHDGALLESVGRCIDDSEIRINARGCIEIKGSHLASKMIKEGETIPLVNEQGWFETNDLGRIENGFLFYEGRSDDLINCGGVKLTPEYIEQAIYEKMSMRSGIAVSGVQDSMRGQIPILAYTSDLKPQLNELIEAFKGAVAKSGVDLGVAAKTMMFDTLPATNTGKIQRRKIAEAYDNIKKQDSSNDRTKNIDNSDSMELKIKQVWQDVLGIESVPTNVSFFDLGGDSLSSISVALKMKKLGVEKTLSKKIFEGYTIQEIANASSENTTVGRSSPDQTATISQSINLTRGILVLLVIAAHWMPGVIERLPSDFAQYNKYLSTLYSFGTPGFAAIFGFGVGFFYLLRYLSSPNSLSNMIRRNAIILLLGMSILAAVKLAKIMLEGNSITGIDIANAYFSVLYFYFFAIISIPLVLKLATKGKNITYFSLKFAVVCFAIHIFIETLNIPPSENGFIQAGILLLTTKYNYFEMMAGLAVGMAIGNWIRENQKVNEYKKVGMLGVLLFAFSLLLCWEMSAWEMLLVWPKGMTIWSWIMYLGMVSALWAVCYRVIQLHGGEVYLFFKNIVCCIGLLAFPMFIGHEIVIPLKDVLLLLGLPFSLLISMGLFLIVSLYLVRKMYFIYYK